MAMRKVLQMGDPRLLEVAANVTEFDTPELHALVRDMKDTMHALDGAGLAAPQIGVGLRLVVFEVEAADDPDVESIPFTVLINPEIIPNGNDMEEDWEGCLSLPGMHGLVPRYASIRYRGVDQFGKAVERRVSGFHARVVQHEADHLDGMLYPRRIADLRYFGFTEALFDETNAIDAIAAQ
jgi:peptide deformylase